MTTAVAENGTLEQTQTLVRFSVSDAAIAAYREEFAGLPALVHTKDGYERCRLAIGTCRTKRGELDQAKSEKNADALRWQRAVNAEHKRLIADLLAIEEPLKAAKKKIDDERERIKREEEAAALRIIEEAARQKAEQEAAEKRAKEEAEAPAKIGNIHLPDAAKEKEKLHFGEVIAVGPGKPLGTVERTYCEMVVKVGQRIVYAPYTGNEVKVGDEMLWIFPQESILAVVGK